MISDARNRVVTIEMGRTPNLPLIASRTLGVVSFNRGRIKSSAAWEKETSKENTLTQRKEVANGGCMAECGIRIGIRIGIWRGVRCSVFYRLAHDGQTQVRRPTPNKALEATRYPRASVLAFGMRK